MPELHLAVFIIAFGTNGDENKEIALADNVVDGPFEGFNATGREIHRNADSPFTVHDFCCGNEGMNVEKLRYFFFNVKNFGEGSGI